MAPWTPCPYAGLYRHDSDSLVRHWARLHTGDAEPLPTDPALLDAWALYHNGEFERAMHAALAVGGDGLALANKAACIYASFVEPGEQTRLQLLVSTAERAQAHQASAPRNANAWFWQGYALGRYSQGINVAKALAKGLGSKVRLALQTTIELAPNHADAHLALAMYHAEVIDKVGELIGSMTHGASKEAGLALYRQALALNPDSAITLHEYATGLLMLQGAHALDEATRLRERAAAFEPLDAMERLHLEASRMALED